MPEALETAEQIFRALKVYCRTTGENLKLPPNASQVIEVGFWERSPGTKIKIWCETGDGWYDGDEGYLPGNLLAHMEDDDDLLNACRQTVTEALTRLPQGLRADRGTTYP